MSDQKHYTVLARRFRPQSFGEVIGQQPVAQALKNAIQSDRVAHAYLFTGARGVGKTSMARILAKALNCPNATDGEPCQQCEICEGIAAGQDIDILEIDGASNRGIDDIRSLRANVTVKSMRTRFKMYIIDEVHMLTKEAFNALLKTLEEPPPNVKFVFCTTEPNKVPDTILSRCQRFDFATIETQNIVIRLAQIAEAEGYSVDEEALELVARRAKGSMRDSQSLFDQLLAFGSESITAEDVHRLFGTASDERLIGLIESLFTGDRASALREFDRSISEGVQLSEVVDQLLNCFRDLMIVGAGADTVALLGVSARSLGEMRRLASLRSLHAIVAALEILSEAKTRMARVSFGRSLAEAALVRISLLDQLSELGRIAEQLGSGSVAPTAAPASAPKSTPAPEPAVEPESSKKKVDETPIAESEAVDEPLQVTPVMGLEAGSEDTLMAEVVERVKPALRAHLKHASLAISGPTVVCLRFPADYHFGRQMCERPDSLAQLRAAIEGLTGTAPRIDFETAAPSAPGSPQETEEAPQPQPASRNTFVTEDDVTDPFVQSAMEVFSATPVKREESVRSRAESDDDSSPT